MAKVIAIEIDIKGQKQVLKLTDAIKQTNKQLKETQKEIDGANTASERLAKQKAYDQLTAQLVRLKAELKGARQEQNNAIRDFEAAKTGVGSYRSLNAELVKTRQAFKELSKAEREGAKGKDLINNIQRLDKELKKIDGSIGQFQRNVGNYEKGMLKLGSSITKVFLGRSLVDGLRRVTGFLAEVVAKNKDTDDSMKQLDGAFGRVGKAAEGMALGFLRYVAPALTGVLNGVTFLAEKLFGLSAISNDALHSFNSQLDGVKKLDQSLSPLADRYDQLSSKTKLSSDEQKELAAITKELAKEVPNATSAFNEFGEATGVNTEAIRGLVAREKELLAVKREIALDEQKNNLAEEIRGVKVLNDLLKSRNISENKRRQIKSKAVQVELDSIQTTKEIARLEKLINIETKDFTKTIEANTESKKTNAKATKITLTEYEKLQKRVETATKALQEQAAKGQPTQKAIDELKQSTIELNAANEKVKAILDSLTPKKEEDTKATKEEAKAVKDLSGEIDQLNQKQQENASLSGIASGRLAVFEEARAQLRQIVGNEDDAAKQVEQIRQNLANRLQQLDRQTLEQQDQTIQAEIDNIEFQKAQELSVFEGSEQEKLLLAQQFNAQLSQLRLEQITTQQQIVAKDVANFKLGEDAKTKKAKEEGEKRKQLATQLVQGFQQVQAAFSQLSAVSAEQDIKRLDDLATKRQENITNLQSELQTASGLEAQFLQQKIQQETAAAEDIAKRKEEILKQENKRKKESAITQAIIAGALGIVNTFSIPPPASFIAAGITAATTAAQIATIAAQEFAGGGLVRNLSGKTGKIGGKGNIAPRANGDNVLATVKTGEVILNKNQQSLLGGASTFGRIGVPGFAKGGRVNSLGAPSLSVSQFTEAVDITLIGEAVTEIRDTIKGGNGKQAKKIKVILDPRDLQQEEKDRSIIKSVISNK